MHFAGGVRVVAWWWVPVILFIGILIGIVMAIVYAVGIESGRKRWWDG
jgi:hypothetical protein